MTHTLQGWRAAGRAHVHGGHETFYAYQERTAGSDRALLLIHGFPTASWDWHKLWSELGARFPRVIAADMMGFGFSSKPADYPYSILDQADLLEGLLRHLGVRSVDLLAHDYGDTVAQELLARHLERGGITEIELGLPGTPLALGEFDRNAGRIHAVADLPDQPFFLGGLQNVVVLDVPASRREPVEALALGGVEGAVGHGWVLDYDIVGLHAENVWTSYVTTAARKAGKPRTGR